MKKCLLIVGIAVGVILIFALWFTITENNFVLITDKNIVLLGGGVAEQDESKIEYLGRRVTESWAQVENVYRFRADLIPNLVATVKGYAEHEKNVLTDVVEARAITTRVNVNPEKLDARSIQQFEEAQGNLSSALSRLMVVVERYPDLKANQNFSELQAMLEVTENRISVERSKFNEAVREYNNYIRQHPFKSRGFEKKSYFEAQADSE